MFDVYCPRHGRRVLLFPGDIERVENTGSGIEVVYRCFCGHRGVLYTGRSRRGSGVATSTPDRFAS
jgi:hypothetical protein